MRNGAKCLGRACLIWGVLGCLAVADSMAPTADDDAAVDRAVAFVACQEGRPRQGKSTSGRPNTHETGKPPGPTGAAGAVTSTQIRSAVERALPPLQKSLVVYAEKRDCFSCHNQGVPLVALKIARSRGLAIDEDAFEGAMALTLADLNSALAVTVKGGTTWRGDPRGLCTLDTRSR